MKRSRRRPSFQEQLFWYRHPELQQDSVTGKVYAVGELTVTVNNNNTGALPSQVCDDAIITWSSNTPTPWNQPLDGTLTTVTTNATANTFTQLASAANTDQLVIFNQSAANVLSVGFSASPGTAVVPIAANGSFTFNLGVGSNANRLFVASAGSSQVFSYLIRQMPFGQIITPGSATGILLTPGASALVQVPAGPGFTGNLNQLSLYHFNPAGATLTFPILWRRYSI